VLSATPERIPGLVTRILERADPTGRHSMSPAALQSLLQWNWLGNIAELHGTVTALARNVPASVIERRHLPPHLQQAPRRSLTMMETADQQAILKALGAVEGNKSAAADLLGIGRTTLYRRIRQLGLDGYEGSSDAEPHQPSASTTASVNACGASWGRLCPMPPVIVRCSYLPVNLAA
jgi:transcriptional regulator of acetoin/glycerol metabolism